MADLSVAATVAAALAVYAAVAANEIASAQYD